MENCGIYKIENLINHQVYIGQSVCISVRWRKHRQNAYNSNSKSYDYPLYEEIREYGLENFDFSILELCEPDELNEKEKFYVALYDSYENGYNQTRGGGGGMPFYSKVTPELLNEIIDLLKNSDKTQNEIAELCDLHYTLISMINTGAEYKNPELSYPIRINKNPPKYCIDCGIEITQESTRCVKCAHKLLEVVDRPSKEELEQILLNANGNFTAVGRDFGVKDNTIRKWCKAYELPYSTSAYKTKKTRPKRTSPELAPVAKLNVNTEEVLEIYLCIADAERANGNSGHIGDVCKGKRKTCKGFKWKYL